MASISSPYDRLLVIVTSWNRPGLLRQTLNSLRSHTDAGHTDVVVVDNGSDEPTQEVIRASPWLAGVERFRENRGINAAVETALDNWQTSAHDFVLVSDADMEYRAELFEGCELLHLYPEIGAVSFQHSPEHPEAGRFISGGREWITKTSERGCALLFRTATLSQMRPLPTHILKDFDWWVCRDAPHSLQVQGKRVAVLPGGARHLGWQPGASTWQRDEIPEFEMFRGTGPSTSTVLANGGDVRSMTHGSVAIITPTLGRPTLARTLESLLPQLGPHDEWFVIGDGPQPFARSLVERCSDDRIRYLEVQEPRSTYGNSQRNHAMRTARADWLLFLDDDDELLPGALASVRSTRERVPQMFRMDYRPRNAILWQEQVVREGNVGGGMFVVPRVAGRWTIWPEVHEPCVGDFHFIRSTLALWPDDALQWRREIIYLCHVHGRGR